MKLGLKIKALRKQKNESQEVFSDKIGINRGTLASIELCKQNPTIETLRSIAVNYNISLDDLILERNPKGNITEEMSPNLSPNLSPNDDLNTKNQVNEPVAMYRSEYFGIPLIPIEAMAGLGTGEAQAVFENHIQERLVIPEFKGKVDFYIKIYGNSMYPRYQSGDIVACRYINEITFIQWNKPYVLDTTQGALVKLLIKSTESDEVICKSDNKDYPEFSVKLADIRAIALVVGVIRFE